MVSIETVHNGNKLWLLVITTSSYMRDLDLMKVVVLEACKKEMMGFQEEMLADFLNALAIPNKGINLSMPLSKSNNKYLKYSGIYNYL